MHRSYGSASRSTSCATATSVRAGLPRSTALVSTNYVGRSPGARDRGGVPSERVTSQLDRHHDGVDGHAGARNCRRRPRHRSRPQHARGDGSRPRRLHLRGRGRRRVGDARALRCDGGRRVRGHGVPRGADRRRADGRRAWAVDGARWASATATSRRLITALASMPSPCSPLCATSHQRCRRRPSTASDELARLIRLNWRMERRAIENEREAARLRAELADRDRKVAALHRATGREADGVRPPARHAPIPARHATRCPA